MRTTSVALSGFAKFKQRSTFYSQKRPMRKAYGITPNLARPSRVSLDEKYQGFYHDAKMDLRDKDHIDRSEGIRGPGERDYYQDHTYYTQWEDREHNVGQKTQLNKSFAWMKPGFQKDPWLWFPGDTVEVVSGEHAGQRGVILNIIKYKNECCVQNINVQSVTIPATEQRAEQVIQREHAINVDAVKLVDPTTNEVADVRMITVRNKETGELEKNRISLQSGVMIPIPAVEDPMDGDPVRDTPLQDAEETTFDEGTELAVMVKQKLEAMENHFVAELKKSYEFHNEFAKENAKDMEQFQVDVLARAKELVKEAVLRASDPDLEDVDTLQPESSDEYAQE